MGPIALIAGALMATYLVYKWLKLPQHPPHKSREFVDKSKQGPIAHRAGRPENTLAGIRRAKEEGASGIEVDLTFTKDGVPVLLHDATVDRTSNGSGRLSELTFEEVRKLDFGYKFGSEYTGERIPTLQEALQLCEELDLQIYLEVKVHHAKAVKVITECVKGSSSLYKRLAVISFFPNLLYKLRKADPNITCGFTIVEKALARHPDGKLEGKAAWKLFLAPYVDMTMRWCARAWLLDLLGVNLILPQKDMLLSGVMEHPGYWERRGVSVVTWTVNKREEKTIIENNLKIAFLTDCLDPNSTAPEQFVEKTPE